MSQQFIKNKFVNKLKGYISKWIEIFQLKFFTKNFDINIEPLISRNPIIDK